MIKRIANFVLDERADTIAPWTFLAGSLAMAVFLSRFHGALILLYLAGFACAGILAMLLFSLAVSKYRDRKYAKESREICHYQHALTEIQNGTADDLTDEQISLLVKRSRSE